MTPTADLMKLVEEMISVCGEWMDMHREYVEVADIERWSYPPDIEDIRERLTALTATGEALVGGEVVLEPGVKVPVWLLDYAQKVELYMKANLPGPWRIGGIQSHDYALATPAQPQASDAKDAGRYRAIKRMAAGRWAYRNGGFRIDTPVFQDKEMTFDECIDYWVDAAMTAAKEAK